jgi:hypothetical protein
MSIPPPGGQPSWPPQPGSPYPYGPVQQSSNGTLILILGIISIVCLPILGPVAWIMGNSALAAINSGAGNPTELGNVTAGRICGMVGTAFLVLGFIYWVIVMATVGIAGLQHPGSFGSTPSRP